MALHTMLYCRTAQCLEKMKNLPSHSRGSLEALTEEASMTAAAAMIDTDFILLLSELVWSEGATIVVA